jgi:hypothetical protein
MGFVQGVKVQQITVFDLYCSEGNASLEQTLGGRSQEGSSLVNDCLEDA